jgi:hypothetical protein
MNKPNAKIRYSIESGGIKRKLISVGISGKDGSLFIALRGLVTPVFFLNLIVGNKITDHSNYGFEYDSKNIKVSFHTAENEICLPLNDRHKNRIVSKPAKTPWWNFFAPNVLSQIIIPYNILSSFPQETKTDTIKCYNFNLDSYSFNQDDPLVIYFCLINDQTKLKDGIIISGNRWESDSWIYKLDNVNSFITIRVSQRIDNSMNTLYGKCKNNIFWIFDPELIRFDN